MEAGQERRLRQLDPADRLLTRSEVAALFRVNPKTVTNWAKYGTRYGKLPCVRTLGGHRRYREVDVLAYRLSRTEPATTVAA